MASLIDWLKMHQQQQAEAQQQAQSQSTVFNDFPAIQAQQQQQAQEQARNSFFNNPNNDLFHIRSTVEQQQMPQDNSMPPKSSIICNIAEPLDAAVKKC